MRLPCDPLNKVALASDTTHDSGLPGAGNGYDVAPSKSLLLVLSHLLFSFDQYSLALSLDDIDSYCIIEAFNHWPFALFFKRGKQKPAAVMHISDITKLRASSIVRNCVHTVIN